jgi:hypothetical protein
MRGAMAAGMDMDTSGGAGQSVVAHHPQWSGAGGSGGGVPVGPPPPGPPHGARPVPHPPGLQPPGPAAAASAAAVSSSLHQNGGGIPPSPMENSVPQPAAAVPLQAAVVPHSYSSPATLSYTREEGRGEHWVAPPPTRIQVPSLPTFCYLPYIFGWFVFGYACKGTVFILGAGGTDIQPDDARVLVLHRIL